MSDKATLVRVFAHELRNTLSPIRSAAQLLRMRQASPEQLDATLKIMERALDSTLATIDRFVDADAVMQGDVALATASHGLAGMVAQAIEQAGEIAKSAGARIRTTVPEDVRVEADAGRTTALIAQLIEQAVAQSAAPADVEITTELKAQEVALAIAYMPSAEAPSPDAMLASFRSTHRGGLGLRVAQRVVELQGGSLTASNESSGRQVLRLQLGRSSADAMASEPSGALRPNGTGAGDDRHGTARPDTGACASAGARDSSQGVPGMRSRILIVDDNAAVRGAYREALEEMGYEVMLAADGEEALRVAESGAPQVALIDIHLPRINGYQVARRLRARHPADRLTLVMLSGMMLDADLVRLSKSAGFDHCLDKGDGPRALDRLLRAS